MTNSYDVDHGLSQDAPGPLEPVEIAQQPGSAPATGNTARDQEMYAAGIRTGEENAKHNAAIRAGAPGVSTVEDAQDGVTVLPDGSACALASLPLPATHWLYAEREYAPGADEPKELPAPILTHAQRDAVVAAIRYAVRGATMCGKEQDFDPDALVQNAVYALCGPYGPAAAAPAAGDTRELTLAQKYEDACILANANALDAARWRAYAAQFPEISAAFLAVHAVDGGAPLPTIKGASITGGYVVVTPAGWDADKATKLRDAILRLFPVNPAHTPRPSDELAAQRKGDA